MQTIFIVGGIIFWTLVAVVALAGFLGYFSVEIEQVDSLKDIVKDKDNARR